jgi:hypothetical protein
MNILTELLRQILAVVAYSIFRKMASAPAIAYVTVITTTVLFNTRTVPCTLQSCNRMLLQSTVQVSVSLLLYGLLGLYNLDEIKQDD